MANQTTVTVTNNVTYTQEVNQIAQSLGIQPIPAGSSVAESAQNSEKSFMTAVPNQWATMFPNISLPPGQAVFGYMGPASALTTNPPPQCVIELVNNNIVNWQLPTTTDTGTQIAETIAVQVLAEGGQPNWSKGVVQVDTNDSIAFLVGYGTLSIQPDMVGVLYIFAMAAQSSF
jgi:hypothetical protein